jgi:hypothetical protein
MSFTVLDAFFFPRGFSYRRGSICNVLLHSNLHIILVHSNLCLILYDIFAHCVPVLGSLTICGSGSSFHKVSALAPASASMFEYKLKNLKKKKFSIFR